MVTTLTYRLLLFGLLCFCAVLCAENNVCPTFKDYYTIKENPHCWYDVAAEKTAVCIILRRILTKAVMEYYKFAITLRKPKL